MGFKDNVMKMMNKPTTDVDVRYLMALGIFFLLFSIGLAMIIAVIPTIGIVSMKGTTEIAGSVCDFNVTAAVTLPAIIWMR